MPFQIAKKYHLKCHPLSITYIKKATLITIHVRSPLPSASSDIEPINHAISSPTTPLTISVSVPLENVMTDEHSSSQKSEVKFVIGPNSTSEASLMTPQSESSESANSKNGKFEGGEFKKSKSGGDLKVRGKNNSI